jgi:hypothetical protein
VYALESARTRLAIAIALEKKYTLPVRWQYYLDTADQMRQCVKRLRNAKILRGDPKGWHCALEMLRKLPAQEQADELCRTLAMVLAEIEI